MSQKQFVIIGAFVCCILVAVSIAITVKVVQNAQESCSTSPFHDLPTQFRVVEQYFSTRSRAKLYGYEENNNTELGSLTTRPSVFKTAYSYRDLADHVVAEAEKGSFLFTFTINQCAEAGARNVATYELEREFFVLFGQVTVLFVATCSFFSASEQTKCVFVQVNYYLRKNGTLIGKPTKNTWFQCRPDVMIEGIDGSLLAVLDRSCFGSLFTDHWRVTNYRPDLVENYVLAFIAYVTTQYENDQRSSSSSSSKKKS